MLFLLDLAAATGQEAYLEDARRGAEWPAATWRREDDLTLPPRADWHDDRRGRYRTTYEDSKQRERLLGTGVQRLLAAHPGAAHHGGSPSLVLIPPLSIWPQRSSASCHCEACRRTSATPARSIGAIVGATVKPRYHQNNSWPPASSEVIITRCGSDARSLIRHSRAQSKRLPTAVPPTRGHDLMPLTRLSTCRDHRR
ncbi:hypothetical protein MTP10_33770 [Nonomuraea sp. 3-1Str]|uniref:hypothetical protein n=1 Tax=Nonomuraea sp. 3-1Str TaxID=2929801 RepID=UPI00285B98C6|nr:hypothetical protein [Nonomuraea sp. 3-1Str]MDR8413688.1 hypothetical protein [Nonomuraea sp. 3-1Str]